MSISHSGPAIPIHPSAPTSSTPPAKISSNCHLDPSSYVKGRHLLTIEANVVVHPRTYLFTEIGPVTIRHGTVITEKCILGRREKNESSHQRGQASIAVGRPMSMMIESSSLIAQALNDGSTQVQETSDLPEIVIGPNAHLHAAVIIQAPSTVSDSVVLESGVVVSPGCVIGAHSKICAGITLPPGTVIPEWTVVYGMNGCMRRRKADDGTEETRMDLLKRERATIESLLKSAARNLGAAGGASGSAKSKRESMIRG